MLKVYSPIENDIYDAHKLVVFLVDEVWLKAKLKQTCKSKLNIELITLCKDKIKFFKQIVIIYNVCKTLSTQDKRDFKVAFHRNNKIKELCEGTLNPIKLNTLNKRLVKAIKPFFKSLYVQVLGWKLLEEKYGNKKDYYDKLNIHNSFTSCPCCGFGDLKTIYDKGRSAFDHYLPQKHYPFSVINFNNLVPICTTCNSDEKGEVDILKYQGKIFYPFADIHPKINVTIDVDSKALPKLIELSKDEKDKITKSEIRVFLTPKMDEVNSWDSIFGISTRYFAKVAANRVSWFNKVTNHFENFRHRIDHYTIEIAFDDIIKNDSDDQLGFLKSPYLASLKENIHLIKAINEVKGSSVMSNNN